MGKSEAKAAEAEVTFHVDDRVSHDLFGEGVIREVSRAQNGRDAHIYIEFDEPHQRFETSPSTRFRKILSSYIQKLERSDVIEDDPESLNT